MLHQEVLGAERGRHPPLLCPSRVKQSTKRGRSRVAAVPRCSSTAGLQHADVSFRNRFSTLNFLNGGCQRADAAFGSLASALQGELLSQHVLKRSSAGALLRTPARPRAACAAGRSLPPPHTLRVMKSRQISLVPEDPSETWSCEESAKNWVFSSPGCQKQRGGSGGASASWNIPRSQDQHYLSPSKGKFFL